MIWRESRTLPGCYDRPIMDLNLWDNHGSEFVFTKLRLTRGFVFHEEKIGNLVPNCNDGNCLLHSVCGGNCTCTIEVKDTLTLLDLFIESHKIAMNVYCQIHFCIRSYLLPLLLISGLCSLYVFCVNQKTHETMST